MILTSNKPVSKFRSILHILFVSPSIVYLLTVTPSSYSLEASATSREGVKHGGDGVCYMVG